LKPFRNRNWVGRWQRLGQASDRLAILPPIDVLRYDDTHWIVDGHNRVAMALYTGQDAIDADVVDLVDPARRRSEPAESFASLVEDSRELRAAVSRARPTRRSDPP
jgi:ParB-like chromosome segregation protein Spo0J